MEKSRDNVFSDVTRILAPNPQRIRNILTLEERVQAIKAYECRPEYSKIAEMFSCGWKQIRNIVANRDKIMKSYEKAIQNKEHGASNNIDKSERLEVTETKSVSDVQMRKIKFLEDCMIEYALRLKYKNPNSNLTEEFICNKTLEFRDKLKIEAFKPNKAWIKHFIFNYNMKFFMKKHVVRAHNSSKSFEFKDIIAYCTKMKRGMHCSHPKTMISEFENKKLLNLFERSLYRFTQRMQSEYKQETTPETLLTVALRMRDLLEVKNLCFDKVWFETFQRKYSVAIAKDSKLIQDYFFDELREIIIYCTENDLSESSITRSKPIEINNEYIELDDDTATEVIKDPVEKKRKLDGEAENETHNLKIQKVESLGIHKEQEHWSDDVQEELPKLVRNYTDALKLLKPLEEFAMLEENFRVIGLISQLETIFKTPPNKNEDKL